jgi:hypothetical protein
LLDIKSSPLEEDMKTEFVFVVKLECPPATGTGAFDSSEVDGCVDALQERYSAAVVSVPVPANPTSSNWKAYIDNDEELKKDRAAIPGFTTKYKDIGLYVVSHGKTGSIGGLGGDSLAELVKELGFRSLRKVCVVSCFTGGEKIAAGVDLDQSFFGKFCTALAPDLTPMVAAYTGYVTVGFATAAVDGLHEQNGKKKISVEEFEKIKLNGSKIIRTKNGQGKNMALNQANPAWKAKNKLVYQYKSGTISSVDLAQWHDAA